VRVGAIITVDKGPDCPIETLDLERIQPADSIDVRLHPGLTLRPVFHFRFVEWKPTKLRLITNRTVLLERASDPHVAGLVVLRHVHWY